MKHVLLAAMGFMLLAAPASAQNKNELMRTDQECAKISGEKGASASFEACYADDAAHFMAAPEPLFGKPKVLEMAKGMAATKLTWEPRAAEVAVGGDMGWTWGRFAVSGKAKDGKPVKSEGSYMTVWKRTKGTWKITATINQPDQAGRK